jgi:hypothetical protein
MNDADDPAFTHTMMRGLVAATLGQVTVLSLMKGFGRFRAQRSSPPLLYPPRASLGSQIAELQAAGCGNIFKEPAGND